MSGLKERLQRLKRPAAEGGSGGGLRGADAGVEDSRAPGKESGNEQKDAGRASSAAADERVAPPGWERLGGVRVERNAHGAFLLREQVYAPDYRHGKEALGELAELAGELGLLAGGGSPLRQTRRQRARTVAARGIGSANTDGTTMRAGEGEEAAEHGIEQALQPERLLFFDTETTGLGVGAGNVPFMVGLGFYDADRFVVQQLFIRGPAEEAAMLAYFEHLLARFTHIVSYNGRSFDWPIVQNRFVLARRKRQEDVWRQIDLLYPARSLWRTSLPSCRLSAVESEKLGFRREADVPGSQAPMLYLQYLAEPDPGIIAGVFVHNEHDIVSLAALAIHMAKLLRGKEPVEELGDEELLRLSLWLDKLGRAELAERTRAQLALRLHGGGPRPGRDRLLLELAAAYKKLGRYDSAAELWRRFVAERGGSFACPVEPYIELAMHGEHRERRYGEALAYTEEALRHVWKRMSMSRVSDQQRELAEALQKRIRRLRDKLRREQTASAAEAAPGSGKAADQPPASAASNGMGQEARIAGWPVPPRKKRIKPEYAMESLI
ncbi:ribonuclease H-like domain-containing protein [Gordoniibacillus kamchatkensis]|uniref:ribonuclease H-like domain-containing protein n=1 Tax=Gordoniibacillus kamchatkensis TaxID=1590651 RepID=UPI000696879E|nr:ribonuclease H-like domain-containing protein [Paenibacillus sp. VKM B-2647]